MGGMRRGFRGQITLRNVEIRYYGKWSKRAGISVTDLAPMGTDEKIILENITMNRGYYTGIHVEKVDDARIDSCVIYRSQLPSVSVSKSRGSTMTNNLGVVALDYGTYRAYKVASFTSGCEFGDDHQMICTLHVSSIFLFITLKTKVCHLRCLVHVICDGSNV
jgi:hypothetical protein